MARSYSVSEGGYGRDVIDKKVVEALREQEKNYPAARTGINDIEPVYSGALV